MAMNYDKPLKAKFEIEGVTNEVERQMAGDILMRIYNLACDVVNGGGIEQFNSEWERTHPNWVYSGDPDDEYDLAYFRYFKSIADRFSDMVRSNGITYKLREYEPCLIDFKHGYVSVYGYKESD